jgi:hypothetical protein
MMNRYRIFEDVPKKKARTGKGEVLAKRIARSLRARKIDFTMKYRKGRMKNDLIETLSYWSRAAEMDGWNESTGYWEIKWKGNSK